MAGVPNNKLLDLIQTTLQNLPNLDFEHTLQKNNYVVINKWFTQHKVELDGGHQISRRIILDPVGNARQVRLYEKFTTTVIDQFKEIKADWTYIMASWAIDQRELRQNSGESRIVDLLKSRVLEAHQSIANKLETRAWSTPDDSSDDRNPLGLPYWMSKVNAGVSSSGDFIGQTVRYGGGTTTTTKGGIDGSLSTNAGWRNYAFTYDAIDAEFVRRMRTAFHRTNFISPNIVDSDKTGSVSNFAIYMGVNELTEYEDLVTRQNDNIGRDSDPFHNATMFRGVPILRAASLDSETDGAIYAVNHDKFYPVVMQGDWLRNGESIMDVELPDVVMTPVLGTYQYFCTNVRESGFVGSKVPAT